MAREVETKQTEEYTTTFEIQKKATSFQFTLNQVDKWNELQTYIESLKSVSYALACKEYATTTGHEHIHLYVRGKNAWKPSVKKCCGAHIEACKGSPKQNIDYIRKQSQGGEIIWEFGEEPHQGVQLTGEDIKKMTKAEIAESNPLCARAYLYAKEVMENEEAITIDDWINKVEQKTTKEVFYLFGEAGAGKTFQTAQIMKQLIAENKIQSKQINVVKYENNFWHVRGETGAEIALYDDFRDSHLKVSEFIKFISNEIHVMNIKGGQKENKYKYIFITSVQNPFDDIYGNVKGEPIAQWCDGRRIQHFIYCYKDLNGNYKTKQYTWDEWIDERNKNI